MSNMTDMYNATSNYFSSKSNGRITARDYMLGQRGISDETARLFNIGDGVGTLPVQISKTMAENYVLMPIKKASGRLVGFKGRLYQESTINAAMNLSKGITETGVKKSQHLFGVDLAYESMLNGGYAIVVEGEIDCMRMVQMGYPMTVATLGCTPSYQQLAYIKAFCDVVYVFYDNDGPGKDGFEKLSSMGSEINLTVKNLLQPILQVNERLKWSIVFSDPFDYCCMTEKNPVAAKIIDTVIKTTLKA